MPVQNAARVLMTKCYLTWSLLPLPASKQDAASTQHSQHPRELPGSHSSCTESSHPLPRHRQPPVLTLSERAGGEKGGGSLQSGLLRPASSAVLPNRAGEAETSPLPRSQHLHGQPQGTPLTQPLLCGHLAREEDEGGVPPVSGERQRSEPRHTERGRQGGEETTWNKWEEEM